MLRPSIFGENLFDDFFNFAFEPENQMQNMEKKLYGHHAKNIMKTDIKETDSGYELEIDLPGFKKEEVKASLDNGYLLIRAEKGLNKEVDQQDAKNRSERYIRKERYSGTCERSFYVGDTVTQQDIKGEFKHGVLKLFVPKKEPKPISENDKYISID